jgi:ribosome-associated translation inhibitor RaiA
MRATMWVDLRGSGFEGHEPLRTYAEQRLRSSLGPLERGLDVVTVCLARHDGPGGRHTRCRMLVRALPWADLVVQEAAPDVFAAIDRTAERLAHAIELATRQRRRPELRADAVDRPRRERDRP